MSQAIDFEELVVGCLLDTRGISFRDVQLEPDDFDSPWFRQAYGVMQAVYAEKGLLDVWLVLERVSDPVVRQRVLDSLQIAFVPAHLPFYVSKVVEQSVSRQLVQIALESQADDGDVSERIDTLRSKLDALKVVQAVEIPHLAWDLQVMLNDVLSPKALIKTCFAGLNNLIVGLKQSRLYVFGARPGVGKTVVGLQLAWEIAREQDVLFFSLEMDKTDLLKRVVAGELDIDLGLLEKGAITEKQKKDVNELIGRVHNRLIVADKGGQTVAQLRSYLIAVQAKRNVEVVVVDYLQLIDGGKAENETLKIGKISEGLKKIAKDYDVPMLALSQLNRGLESRADKRPMMSDLRQSGAIEQTADLIIMLYRDEVYNKDSADKGIMELIVVKHRNGSIGTVRAYYEGKYTRVDNLQHERGDY